MSHGIDRAAPPVHSRGELRCSGATRRPWVETQETAEKRIKTFFSFRAAFSVKQFIRKSSSNRSVRKLGKKEESCGRAHCHSGVVCKNENCKDALLNSFANKQNVMDVFLKSLANRENGTHVLFEFLCKAQKLDSNCMCSTWRSYYQANYYRVITEL